jgi:hypothetical protein
MEGGVKISSKSDEIIVAPGNVLFIRRVEDRIIVNLHGNSDLVVLFESAEEASKEFNRINEELHGN